MPAPPHGVGMFTPHFDSVDKIVSLCAVSTVWGWPCFHTLILFICPPLCVCIYDLYSILHWRIKKAYSPLRFIRFCNIKVFMCLHVSYLQPLTTPCWEMEMVVGIHTSLQSRLAAVELAVVVCVLFDAKVLDAVMVRATGHAHENLHL